MEESQIVKKANSLLYFSFKNGDIELNQADTICHSALNNRGELKCEASAVLVIKILNLSVLKYPKWLKK